MNIREIVIGMLTMHGSKLGSNIIPQKRRKTLLSDTESMRLDLVRFQEAGGSDVAENVARNCIDVSKRLRARLY